MPKKLIQNPVTGSIKQPIGQLILAIPGFFGVLVSMAIFMPVYARNIVVVASFLGVTGIIASLWLNFKSNLISKFLGFISIAGLSSIIAIRAFGYLWPQVAFLMGILISLTVVIAHLIPVFYSNLAWFFRGELTHAPKTNIGKYLLKFSLAILPISGFVGAAIGLFLHGRNGDIDVAVVIAGPLFWFLAIILPFSTAHPISPWEPKRKLMDK